MDKPLFVFVPGELSQPVFRQAPPSDFQPAQNSRHMFGADSTIGRTKTGIHSLLIRYLAHYFCGGADVIGDSQLSQSLSDSSRSIGAGPAIPGGRLLPWRARTGPDAFPRAQVGAPFRSSCAAEFSFVTGGRRPGAFSSALPQVVLECAHEFNGHAQTPERSALIPLDLAIRSAACFEEASTIAKRGSPKERVNFPSRK